MFVFRTFSKYNNVVQLKNGGAVISTITFQSIKVKCIRNPHMNIIYDMQISYATLPDGTKIYRPCNGCDFMSSDSACKKCTEKINNLFANGFENIYEVIELKVR